MTLSLSSTTRLIALLGDPVRHSLSPLMQNAAFRAAQVNGAYLALRCDAEDLAGLMRGIARSGGGGNVTLPHKELAAASVECCTDAVRQTGACNTFWLSDGRLWGDNTDVVGFATAVRSLLVRAPAGARVLLVGAGGAARAALAALVTESAEEVVVLNRTVARAEALVERFRASRCKLRVVSSSDQLAGEQFDLVVNSTSLGLHSGDPLPLSPDADVTMGAALDLVYSPQGTRWVHELRQRGIPAADGLEMLLHQGAAAFQRWWGEEAPLAAMRDALASVR